MEGSGQLASVMFLQDDGGEAQPQEDASPIVSAVVPLDSDDAGLNPLISFPREKIKHAPFSQAWTHANIKNNVVCHHKLICDVAQHHRIDPLGVEHSTVRQDGKCTKRETS